jgi:15-cis-phytoene desaturase
MHRYGDGRLRGILSVDVSSCFAPNRHGRRLVDGTSRREILDQILEQLIESLDARTGARLKRAVFAAHLDSEVALGPEGVSNTARLLVHPPGSWSARPDAVLSIPNLFLAADYVRTSVDLASMEGANEAGRRAARGVLTSLGLDTTQVKLYGYEALERFRRLRAVDRWLHAGDWPHLIDVPARLRQGLAMMWGPAVGERPTAPAVLK